MSSPADQEDQLTQDAQHSSPPPAGWYPAPHAGGAQQYWNGAQWLTPAAPAPYVVIQRPPSNGQALGSLIVGIFAIAIAAFVPIPLLGFFALWPSIIGGAITLVLGYLGRKTATRLGGLGRAAATWGLVLGYAALGIVLATVAFWAIAALAAATHTS